MRLQSGNKPQCVITVRGACFEMIRLFGYSWKIGHWGKTHGCNIHNKMFVFKVQLIGHEKAVCSSFLERCMKGNLVRWENLYTVWQLDVQNRKATAQKYPVHTGGSIQFIQSLRSTFKWSKLGMCKSWFFSFKASNYLHWIFLNHKIQIGGNSDQLLPRTLHSQFKSPLFSIATCSGSRT